MILSGHQPNYLPYIGFFNKALRCDVFEFTDHVKYERKEWQNRNKIRTKRGWMWLTVPVHSKNKHGQKINDVRIDNNNDWSAKHWLSLKNNYGKTPFFEDYEGFFADLYSRRWEKLVELNTAILNYLFHELGVKAKVVYSSDLNIEANGTDMIIELCQKVSADAYLSGIGGHAYLEEAKFEQNSIKLYYQNFHHPLYKQISEPFIPNLSVIDLLFNYGSEESRNIILNSGTLDPT